MTTIDHECSECESTTVGGVCRKCYEEVLASGYAAMTAEREHRLRETARADRERTLRIAAEERFRAQGAILDEAVAHAQELETKLAESESYGRANGFREGLRALGGDDDVYERAIATWGPTAQLGMVQEECAELIAAIHRRQRGRCHDEDVAEEAADVWIMLEQLVRILGHELVDEALDRKLARLRSRLDASPHRTEAGR